jgi:hypothetical protein
MEKEQKMSYVKYFWRLCSGGVRTIPACNAVRRGLLHIIDFSLCAVIVRSAFVVFTPRGFESSEKIFV